jgi:hypothetical protein
MSGVEIGTLDSSAETIPPDQLDVKSLDQGTPRRVLYEFAGRTRAQIAGDLLDGRAKPQDLPVQLLEDIRTLFRDR